MNDLYRHGVAHSSDIGTARVQSQRHHIILVLNDIEETRNLIESMVRENGWSVALARQEEDAIAMARSRLPDLILMSLGLELEQLIATARRIRQQAAIGLDVGIVIFCVPSIPEGAEVEVDQGVYITRPDNFDQLRDIIRRLL
jgi:DNA-binding response OmpR family regulator